jgi:oxaloacetate decarboxylase gamma subunit
MEINLIAETFKFLILGMSTVFMFLVVLVYVLQIQSTIIMKFFPQKSVEPQSAGRDGVTSSDNLAVIAAIAVALKHKK